MLTYFLSTLYKHQIANVDRLFSRSYAIRRLLQNGECLRLLLSITQVTRLTPHKCGPLNEYMMSETFFMFLSNAILLQVQRMTLKMRPGVPDDPPLR